MQIALNLTRLISPCIFRCSCLCGWKSLTAVFVVVAGRRVDGSWHRRKLRCRSSSRGRLRQRGWIIVLARQTWWRTV